MMVSEPPPGAPDIREGTWNGRPIRYRPDRIIVAFNPVPPHADTTLDQLTETLAAAIPGGRLIRLSRKSGRAIFSVAPTADIIDLATALSTREDVAYAEPDLVDSEA